MNVWQFLVPESMDSIRSRGFLTCHLSDSMFPILKWDRDFAMSLQVFPPFLTSLNYSVFLLWPAGVTQISFQRLVPSLASSDSIIEFLSPLSLLYSLDWLVLNSLFWWYCNRFFCIVRYWYKLLYFDFELLYNVRITLGINLVFLFHALFFQYA